LLTENWEHSNWAAFEVGAALAQKKEIVPIILKKTLKELPPILSQFRYLNWNNENEQEFKKKLEQIIEQP
jgi:hypothetical protein